MFVNIRLLLLNVFTQQQDKVKGFIISGTIKTNFHSVLPLLEQRGRKQFNDTINME